MKRVWAMSYNVPSEQVGFNVDEVWRDTAVRYYAQGILEKAQEVQQKQPKVVKFPWWGYAAAASVALVLISFAAYRFAIYNPIITVTATAEQPLSVMLEDNTTVLMRKGATLQYPTHFEKEFRQISLSGDAMIEVAKDAKRPFKIDAGQTLVEVLGTIFRLKIGKGQTQLAVKEGKVALADQKVGGKAITLKAGQKGIFDGKKFDIKPAGPNDFALGTGELAFEAAPLSEIFATLSEHYQKDIQFQLADPASLQNCRMTIKFEQQSWSEALEVLQMMLYLEYTPTPDGIIVKSVLCDLENH